MRESRRWLSLLWLGTFLASATARAADPLVTPREPLPASTLSAASAEPVLEGRPVRVAAVRWRWTARDDGHRELVGRVRNLEAEVIGDLSLQIRWLDEAGRVVAEGAAWLPVGHEVSAGSEIDFRAWMPAEVSGTAVEPLFFARGRRVQTFRALSARNVPTATAALH